MVPAVRCVQTRDLVLCPSAVQSAAAESSAMAEVLSRERRLRDRNTQLLIPGKSFKRVLDFLQHAQVGVTARLPFARFLWTNSISKSDAGWLLPCCRVGEQAISDALNNQNLPLTRAWC